MWYPQAAAALSWYFIHPTASSQVDDQEDFFIIYLLSSAWHYSSGIDSFSHLLIFFTRMNRHLACASHLQNVSLFITVMCVSFFCWLSFNIAWVLKDMKITFNLFYTCQYYWVNVCGDFSIFKQPRALSKSAFYGWSSCGQLQKVFPHF